MIKTPNEEPKLSEANPCDFVREVTAKYIGPRRSGFKITGPEDVARFMRAILKDNAREHFIALYLDGAHQVISFSVVSIGTANAAQITGREVFQLGVLVGACAIIVGHNHPSGELTPSREDELATKRLKDAGELLAIKVLDHVIISANGFYSFSEHRKFP